MGGFVRSNFEAAPLAETDDLGAHIRTENVELDVDFAGNNCSELEERRFCQIIN